MTIKHLFPDAWPTLNLDFANSRQLDPRITFTRSSTGTYFNNIGILQTAQDDEARFDHDPVTGECLGLLIEQSRTNLLVYSAEFESWSQNTAVTVTPNAITAPDGTLSGERIQPTTANNRHQVRQSATSSYSAGDYYCLTIYAKAGNNDQIALYIASSNFKFAVGEYDLTNMTAIFTDSSGSASGSALITSMPNDWKKLTLNFSADTAGTTIPVHIGKDDVFGVGDPSEDVYLWGAQVEEDFASSYIPTAGSVVTRAADVAQITGSNFSSWYNDSEATIVSTQIDADGGTGYGVVWGFGAGATNRIELRQISAEFRRGFYITGPSGGNISEVPLVYTKTSHAQQYTVGVAINASGADYAAEGVGVSGDTFTDATMPVIGTLYLSHGTTLDIASKTIARLAYYPYKLSDEQLQVLTS